LLLKIITKSCIETHPNKNITAFEMLRPDRQYRFGSCRGRLFRDGLGAVYTLKFFGGLRESRQRPQLLLADAFPQKM